MAWRGLCISLLSCVPQGRKTEAPGNEMDSAAELGVTVQCHSFRGYVSPEEGCSQRGAEDVSLPSGWGRRRQSSEGWSSGSSGELDVTAGAVLRERLRGLSLPRCRQTPSDQKLAVAGRRVAGDSQTPNKLCCPSSTTPSISIAHELRPNFLNKLFKEDFSPSFNNIPENSRGTVLEFALLLSSWDTLLYAGTIDAPKAGFWAELHRF